MRWINTEVGTLRAKPFLDSSPAARGTWFCVLGWCVEQENTGCIQNAGEWTDRQWLLTCGVSLREVRAAVHLLRWEAKDLFVLFYPVDKELEVQAKRSAGKAGGLASGKARSKQDASTASSTACDSASTEGNGRERNGRERNGREDGPHHRSDGTDPTPALSLISSPPPDVKKKKAAADLLVDAAYLAEMKQLYVPADVDRAWADMRRWLKEPRGKGKAATKRRFGTFLRDAEPIATSQNSQKKEGPAAPVAPADWSARYERAMGGPPPAGVDFGSLPGHVQQAILQTTNHIQTP